MAKYPVVPVYLFYGSRTEDILKARNEVVKMLLKGGTEESVINYDTERKGNAKKVELERAMPKLSADLANLSFIEEATKIAVIHDPAEVYAGGFARRPTKAAAKKAKAAPEAEEDQGPRDVMNWFEKILPITGNHVILLAFEDESEDQIVNEQNPFVQLVMRIGTHQKFGESKLVFELEDAIRTRDMGGALRIIRELWSPQTGDNKVYGAVTRSMRFMLQAQISRDRRISSDPEVAKVCFPASKLSIFNQHDFVKRKYTQSTVPYRMVDLAKAYESLTAVYRAMRPAPGQLHVADARALLERILVELFASPVPR